MSMGQATVKEASGGCVVQPYLAQERHKINVSFPCLDFSSSLIFKDLEKTRGKKVILFC